MHVPDGIIEMEGVNPVRNRIFLRYVVSYALVLFLPIFLLYFYFDGAIIRRYSDEMTATDSSMLIQLRDTVDAKFQQLFNLAYVIQNTSALNPKNIGTDIVARDIRRKIFFRPWTIQAASWCGRWTRCISTAASPRTA